jgi:hypothetical protein
VRTWTDRSGSFKVEAEFIGLKDGKIHLHKQNGVKIAVPVNKMAIEDLEYVERATGVSLDDDKPLSEIKRRSTEKRKEQVLLLNRSLITTGLTSSSVLASILKFASVMLLHSVAIKWARRFYPMSIPNYCAHSASRKVISFV